MATLGGWDLIEPPLGSGGQGTVYKARSPARVATVASARRELREAIRRVSNPKGFTPAPDEEADLTSFISSIGELLRPDDQLKELGAFKKLKIPTDNSIVAQAAVHRFEREVEALKSIQHPGILRLIDANTDERWFVSEYLSRGTLDVERSAYRGDALSALRGFRTIVEAVAQLHKSGYVHRDIKSNNVFIREDGSLVLGDFGVVFFEDDQRTRLTEQYERVGSRDWMAPWAHVGVRVDDVRPSFDIFPLGKLLWTMVSGRRILPPYYTHRSPKWTLEELFPGQYGMEQVNSVLDKCVVTDEGDCLKDASQLLAAVDAAIEALERTETAEEILFRDAISVDSDTATAQSAGRVDS